MAIFPSFPGLTISIRINNRKLPEYRDDDIEDPPRTISYMIEAVPDSIFSINAKASPETNFEGSALACYFYVDGKYVDGTLIDASNNGRGGGCGGHTQSQGRYVRSDMLRRYQFASRERQIELVEKVSTSLSSRGRASKTSSETPEVSYMGYNSVEIHSAAPTPMDSRMDTSPVEPMSEAYRSTAEVGPRGFAPSSPENYHSYAPPTRDRYQQSTTGAPVLPDPTNAVALPFRAVVGQPSPDFPMGVNPSLLARRVAEALNRDRNPRPVQEETTAGPAEIMQMPRRRPYGPGAPAPREPPTRTREHYASRAIQAPKRRARTDWQASVVRQNLDGRFGDLAAAPPSTTSDDLSATAPLVPKADVSSATAGSDFTDPDQLGTIKIVVCHVNKKETVAFGRNASTTAQIGNARQEAVKDKSGGLLVRFTAPQAVSPITTWNVGAVNDNDNGDTSVTYLYHYRTREMLDALGVLSKEVKEEVRVKPPFPSGAEASESRNVDRGDLYGNLLADRRFLGLDGTRANGVGPVDSDMEGGLSPEEAGAVASTEADNDWEMVADEQSGV